MVMMPSCYEDKFGTLHEKIGMFWGLKREFDPFRDSGNTVDSFRSQVVIIGA